MGCGRMLQSDWPCLQVNIMQISKQTQSENENRFEPLFNDADHPDYSALREEDIDVLVEKLVDNMQASPLGRLLNVISRLPEVRTEKVEHARRHLDQSEDCWDTKMDIAMDRVLEEMVFDE